MESSPPFSGLSNEELLFIVFGLEPDYTQIQINEAREELDRRGVTPQDQNKWFDELEPVFKGKTDEEIANEDYSLFEKITMIIAWPKELLGNWWLKKEGYHLKAKRRLQLIGLGIIMYMGIYVLIILDFDRSEQKRLEEIRNFKLDSQDKKMLDEIRNYNLDTLAKTK
jgi:hypothetical protein